MLFNKLRRNQESEKLELTLHVDWVGSLYKELNRYVDNMIISISKSLNVCIITPRDLKKLSEELSERANDLHDLEDLKSYIFEQWQVEYSRTSYRQFNLTREKIRFLIELATGVYESLGLKIKEYDDKDVFSMSEAALIDHNNIVQGLMIKRGHFILIIRSLKKSLGEENNGTDNNI